MQRIPGKGPLRELSRLREHPITDLFKKQKNNAAIALGSARPGQAIPGSVTKLWQGAQVCKINGLQVAEVCCEFAAGFFHGPTPHRVGGAMSCRTRRSPRGGASR
jgi:hypothetical protein